MISRDCMAQNIFTFSIKKVLQSIYTRNFVLTSRMHIDYFYHDAGNGMNIYADTVPSVYQKRMYLT